MASTRIYSTQFVEVADIDVSGSYVVPAGHVAVVRDITALMFGTADDTAVEVLNASTGVIMWYWLPSGLFPYTHQDLRQVVPAGSEITGASSGPNGVHLRVAGYLLTAP